MRLRFPGGSTACRPVVMPAHETGVTLGLVPLMRSIGFRDPEGYAVGLAARTPARNAAMDLARSGARERLEAWQRCQAATA